MVTDKMPGPNPVGLTKRKLSNVNTPAMQLVGTLLPTETTNPSHIVAAVPAGVIAAARTNIIRAFFILIYILPKHSIR